MRPLLKTIIILIALTLPASLNARDYIPVKAERDISLSDLIRSSGFDLDDDKLVSFLEEFLRLNEDIKSLSLIPKGKAIRLPSKYLKKIKVPVKKEKGGKRPVQSEDANKETVLTTQNIKKLFDYLGETISVHPGEVIVFPLNEKASLSLDTDYFPVLQLPGQHFIILDLKERLPHEIKDIVEFHWPEYSVISGRDMKTIINSILDSIGYSCLDDGKVIMGNEMQVEVTADCIIMHRGEDIMDSDIIILSIIKEDGFGFPEKFLEWAKNSGIGIIDLYIKETPTVHKEARLFSLPPEKEEFIVSLLTFLGYEVKKNVNLGLTERKDYKLRITADIAFRFGKKTKLIDLSGLPQPVIGILKRNGIDMISINSHNESRKTIIDILDFLSLDYEGHPEITSAMITPQKVKYRVKAPGIVVKSRKGNLFLSNYHDSELLRSLIDSRLTFIKYN